jgi:predicted small secreted protein
LIHGGKLRTALDSFRAAGKISIAMSKIVLLLVGAALMCGLSACNTISGVGQDVSAVGRDVSTGARSVQRSIDNN